MRCVLAFDALLETNRVDSLLVISRHDSADHRDAFQLEDFAKSN